VALADAEPTVATNVQELHITNKTPIRLGRWSASGYDGQSAIVNILNKLGK